MGRKKIEKVEAASQPQPHLPAKKKRKRRSNEYDDACVVVDKNNDNQNEIPTKKKPAAAVADRSVNWTNLDFILSLQSKQMGLQRKIELAFEFVTTHDKTSSRNSHQLESVQLSRLISFLNDWVQSLLISSDKKIPIESIDIDPCLDYRCWAVFKFCLEQPYSNLRFSPNLLRAVSRIINEASSVEGMLLFDLVSHCFSILFSSYGRSFNASMDLWLSAVAASLDFIHKIFTDDFDLSCHAVAVTADLTFSVLLPFANYLRAHPSPKNVFPVLVDRLLEPLLTVLVLLDRSSSGSKGESARCLLGVVDDILMNGIFHPAHLDGFLCLRSSEKYVRTETHTKGVDESKMILKSYHKHLFTKLEKFVVERKISVLEGLGNLLLLFILRVKKHKGVAPSSGAEASNKEAELVDKWPPSGISIGKWSFISDKTLFSTWMDAATFSSVFDVFVQFMEPLLFEVKRWIEMRDCSKFILSDVHSTLKSMNRMLSVFLHEKMYVRTEDTSEGAHRNFLKEVYDTVITFSAELHVYWSSVLKKDDGSSTVVLLIAKEVIAAVGYLLEIEYEVIGNNLVRLWLMIFSFLTIDLCQVDAQHICQEISHLGCLLVNIYSELRQVNGPIFALSKASRFLIYPIANGDMNCSRFLSSTTYLTPETCVKAIVTLLSSQDFRLAVTTAIKSIPEGQTSGCIRQMKTDIAETLDWMQINCSLNVGKTPIQTNSSSSMMDLSFQAELLGRGFAELYTLVLDSFTVTTGNGILVGNSIKDLVTTLQVSLSSLVQSQPNALYEFVFSVTGRKIFRYKMLEGETQLTMEENRMSFLFVFFFQIYMSCRSLYRQSICFMPPLSSKKASTPLGDLFTAYSGKDWMERCDWVDEGYFSWIVKPSTSLITIIRSISDIFLENNFAGYAPVVYTLHAMAIQRLVDLNRQMKAFKFLQERDARASQSKLLNDADLCLSRKGMRKWGKHILVAKQEAADLTSFITGFLPLLATRTNLGSASLKNGSTDADEVAMTSCEDSVWDFCVCSMNEKSLPTALWWLLCHNTDVWCPHATKKNLKRFLSLLFCHCLSSVSGSGDPRQLKIESSNCLRKVAPCHISLELLGDTSLYEETFLCRHLTSSFCCILKKSFSHIFCLSSSSNIDFNSLPDWSEVLCIFEKASASVKNDKKLLNDGGLPIGINSLPPNMLLQEIPACQSVLDLLCWMPKGFLNSGDYVTLATNIFNIERLLVLSLLSCQDASYAESRYQLFKLFVCCRKALRYLAIESNQGKLDARKSSRVAVLFGGTSSLWLLKSVSEVVGLLHAFSEKEHSRQLKNIIFSLMDHTSKIFLTLTVEQMNISIQSEVFKQNQREVPRAQTEDNEHDIVVSDHLEPDSSEAYGVWKCLEFTAETLKEQTRSLIDTKSTDPTNPGNWHEISSLVSCFQGFLWGIASALKVADKQEENSAKCLVGLFSMIIHCTEVFDDLIDVCLSTLLVDTSQAPGTSVTACVLPDIDFMKKHFTFQASSRTEVAEHVPSRTAVETSDVEDENFPAKQQHADVADGMNGNSASDAEDSNENAAYSGINVTKTFSAKKQKTKSVLIKFAAHVLNESHRIDLFELQYLRRPLLQRLLKGEHPEVAFLLGQIFTASSAILRLKQLLFSQTVLVSQIPGTKPASASMIILLGTLNFLLSEFSEMFERPEEFSLVWLDGLIKYLEVISSYFSFTDPVLTRNLYSKLIDMQLRAIGRCITLQGKAATLSSHEIESSTKTLEAEHGSSDNIAPSPGHGKCRINEFKASLRLSFKIFIRKPLELHLLSAVQALERALVGAQEGCSMMYGVCMATEDGGKVSSVVAGGIDCLDLLLESVSGQRRLSLVKRHIQSLISALFNIVLHLQSPLIFYQEEFSHHKSETNPDPGSVVLMCVEVLTKVAGKSSQFQIEPSHVSQSFHLPTTLFRHFLQLTDSSFPPSSVIFRTNEAMPTMKGKYPSIVDCQFSVNLYAACCKLLYTTLRHWKSESERCIALLEHSVCILLHCLETVGACHSVSKRSNFIWQVQEGIKCATFLRRIYEEIRQQRETLGKYSFHFLSNYISIYSGYGPLRVGIIREIDEALRPGLYALIDSCSQADLQQLHVVLEEGPCRSTLSTLQHDYKLNFKYQGKV